jgi:hypothetical protein
VPLREVQLALAKLYTSESSREHFQRDPAEFARSFALEPADFAQISAVSGRRFHAYADSLDRKRANECARLLPLSERNLGPRFRAEFLCYVRSRALGDGPRRYRDDATAFATWLTRGGGTTRIGGRAQALIAHESSFGPGVACYRYFVPELLRAAMRGEPIDAAVERRTLVVRLWRGRSFSLRLP